jgi:hypothetical protein
MSRNEARQYEDMNDGPALLNEFLTPTNEWTEAKIAQLNEPTNGNTIK